MLKWFLILLAFSLTAFELRAQEGTIDQVQAVIAGPLTGQMARMLSDRLAMRPGVLLCRVDPISRNLLMHVDGQFRSSALSMERFFAIHGLHLRCYSRTPRTNTPFILLDPRSCGSAEPARR